MAVAIVVLVIVLLMRLDTKQPVAPTASGPASAPAVASPEPVRRYEVTAGQKNPGPPDLVRPIEKKGPRASAHVPGKLVIRASVPTARILVDGELQESPGGVARLEYTADGWHDIVVEAPGYQTVRTRSLVRGGAHVKMPVVLRPIKPAGKAPGKATPPAPPRAPTPIPRRKM